MFTSNKVYPPLKLKSVTNEFDNIPSYYHNKFRNMLIKIQCHSFCFYHGLYSSDLYIMDSNSHMFYGDCFILRNDRELELLLWLIKKLKKTSIEIDKKYVQI